MVDLSRIRNVYGYTQGIAAQRIKFMRERLQEMLTTGRHGKSGPATRKGQCGFPSDTAGGTGDQDNLPLQGSAGTLEPKVHRGLD